MKKKILVIEDSNTFMQIIADRINESRQFELYKAFSQAEAEKILKEESDFFVAIVDLILPDSEDGSVVDLVTSLNIPAIVLSGSEDKALKDKLIHRHIVDYVVKESQQEIHYAVFLAEKLLFFKGKKALVIEDSSVDRSIITDYLKELLFEVISVKDGKEALNVITSHPDLRLILVDYNMPDMSGLDVTQVIRENFRNDVIVIAITATNSREIEYGFIKLGADDFIVKPIAKGEFNARIVRSIRLLEQLEIIKEQAEIAHELSITDSLTKIYNRVHLDYTLEHEIEKAIRYKHPFSLIVIDIDDFKSVNDRFGHHIGDRILIQLTSEIGVNLRKVDIFGRWGGEEFLIICPHTPCDNAAQIADKLRAHIEKVSFDKINKMTCSFGIAEYREGDSMDSLFQRADKALYQAKRSGKNRVERCLE